MAGLSVDADRHHNIIETARFFSYDHLPEGPLRDMSGMFCEFAQELVDGIDDSHQLSIALQKLLEAKDAAVRAVILMQ